MMMEPITTIAEGRVLTAPASVDELDRQFAAARPGLVRLCASLVGADEADDVAQDVYVVARQRIGQLQDPAALEAWLKRIAANRCYDWHRRRRRLNERLPLLHRSETVASDRSLVELVERLPPRQRTVLVLHYAYGYALNEIAELLSLSHVNVRTIIARTRRSLLDTWKEGDA
ncbi:MAG: RNA polymerase sigma factor [Candidatus Limnocylindria bacterium]